MKMRMCIIIGIILLLVIIIVPSGKNLMTFQETISVLTIALVIEARKHH